VGRNYLTHSAGDAINAVLAAVGYNFRLMLRWLEFILLKDCSRRRRSAQKPLEIWFFTDDYSSLAIASLVPGIKAE
jgi:hypothetical protein